MLFAGGFTFTNFVADLFAVFMFILWFWLLIAVSSDLFRRHDVSGFGKVLWVILLIVLPYSAFLPTSSRKVVAWPTGTRREPNRPAMTCARSWATALPTRSKSSIG